MQIPENSSISLYTLDYTLLLNYQIYNIKKDVLTKDAFISFINLNIIAF